MYRYNRDGVEGRIADLGILLALGAATVLSVGG
jgi:hypothetical protein